MLLHRSFPKLRQLAEMASFLLIFLVLVAYVTAQACDPSIRNPVIRVVPANTDTCTPGELRVSGAIYGPTFTGFVNITGSALFSGVVNFTGPVYGVGGGTVPDPWTNSIALAGTKTFSVAPTVAGSLDNVDIGAASHRSGKFTSLRCDAFTASGNVLDAPTTVGLFDSIYFGPTSSGLVYEGATADANELYVTAADPSVPRAIRFPDASGDVALIVPLATGTLDMSTGNATRTDILAVGINLRVDGAPSGPSTVSRAFLFGDGSFISALVANHTISDVVLMGRSNTITTQGVSGGLGPITGPIILSTAATVLHQDTSGTMTSPAVFGGSNHRIYAQGGTSPVSDYSSIFGGYKGLIRTLNNQGNMVGCTLIGGLELRAETTNLGNVEYALLAGGWKNWIHNTADAVNRYSAIVGGQGSKIIATLNSQTTSGFIAGAFQATFHRSQWSAIVAGANNKLGIITLSHNSIVLAGTGNEMNAQTAVILGGASNKNNHQGAVLMGSGSVSANNYEFRTSGPAYSSAGLLTSDARVKQNIVDLDAARALDLLMLLQPRNYSYHPAFTISKSIAGDVHVGGFIAQEVEEVIPGAVNTASGATQQYHSTLPISAVYDETTGEVIAPMHYPPEDVALNVTDQKSLDSSRLMPYAVAAIQQLKIQADGGAFTTLSASTSLSLSDGVDVALGTTTGSKFGTSPAQKLAFYGAAPVVQDATTGSVASYTIGTGNALYDASCSTGGIGTACLTLEDLVRIAKNSGMAAV